MNRIKELRKKNHMSQIRLSIELEVSQEAISAYEKGNYYPSFPSLVKLSKIFNESIDFIMGLTDYNGLPELSDEENTLISGFRRLNETNKIIALTYIQGLLDAQN